MKPVSLRCDVRAESQMCDRNVMKVNITYDVLGRRAAET